jgi:L-fuconolactonase
MQAMPGDSIDAHHHLWKYSAEDYPWMLDGMEAIRRDFMVEDLKLALQEGGIAGAVAVQARQTLVETQWLLDLASSNKVMRGVVGWVPLVNSNVGFELEKLAANKKLKAMRHVVHDEPDDFYILREDFNRGVALLKQFDLRYDILIFERHLRQTIEFVDRHPGQIFILDHIAKPRIKDGLLEPWRNNLTNLALRHNVYCKLSGMLTEANWSTWIESELRPYVEVVLEAFGPKRIMFGSDWPVLLAAGSYQRWIEVVRRMIRSLSVDEQEWIMGRTATEAYQLD